MNLNDNTQKDNYFNLRKVHPDNYENTIIPKYFELVLPRYKNPRILDICLGRQSLRQGLSDCHCGGPSDAL